LAKHNYIFICSLHRSGAKVLHKMLAEHPSISGFNQESVYEDSEQELNDIYPPSRLFGGIGKFCFNNSARMDEKHPLLENSEDISEKLLKAWQPHWEIEKKYLIQKSPTNIIRSGFLQALFPSAKFIFITRHPAVTAFASRKWCNSGIPELIKHWITAHELMLHDYQKLGQAIIIRYEDLLSDKENTLKSIWNFLTIPPHEVNYVADPDSNNQYLDAWGKYLYTHPFYKFKWNRGNKVVKALKYS
jgi:hypothetical protein